ncbi:MAG: succinate dehydrogenase (quinone) flavoprotein subunit, partial [Verrucomicrobia bacterium]|nr:succinate dehydrogenase (quinone) flavoprotein subunit [Verrucomicrobiota bacterium]
MLDLVCVDGRARGIVTRNLVTGALERHAGHAVVLATGGYSTVYYLSTNAVNSNATAIWRCFKRGAYFANPCYTQIHPTCIPQSGAGQSKLTLMSESLRNDGRVWVPKQKGDSRPAAEIPEAERDYYLERLYPSFGNLVPRDIASRRAKEVCDAGRGVGPGGKAVFLDFADAVSRLGKAGIRERYENLFDMYHEITNEDPFHSPMRIYPAPHYTMGGLWVDYNLMSTIPGLFVAGEANFSDHGANRLGASALMQGLADGYFVLPYTLGNYLASSPLPALDEQHAAFAGIERNVQTTSERMLAIRGKRTVRDFWYDLGRVMWNKVGMARNAAGLTEAILEIDALRQDFWQNVKVSGASDDFNKDLESAGRVADFLELGDLMARDATQRQESCGGHFREEFTTPEGEARRDDTNYSFVGTWQYTAADKPPQLHKEPLAFERVHPAQRSYK